MSKGKHPKEQKTWQQQDPNWSQELQKYEKPVPSRDLLLKKLEEGKAPLTLEEFCLAFSLEHDADAVEGVRRRLKAMERDGQLLRNRRGAYGAISRLDLVAGVVQGHRDGHGVLYPEAGGDSLILPPKQMRRIFHGDRVLCCVVEMDRRGKKIGSIVEIVESNTKQVVGRFFDEMGVGFVEPDNRKITHNILIPKEHQLNAENGKLVVCEIVMQPEGRQQPIGKIIEVLGDHLAPGMEIDVAVRSHGIPHVWPEAVTAEVQKLSSLLDAGEYKNRFDFRNLPFVTIDGEDAQDFDDAVYVEKRKGGGWLLSVAIADVSHYVPLDSALDIEAQERANSVYFPGRVVPMLPEVLSNGLCSLNPHQDRFVLVCQMEINKKGVISGFAFCESVIHSQARLTYTRVGSFLDAFKAGDAESHEFWQAMPHLVDPLVNLYQLYEVLKAARAVRGAIEFETVETKIIFDDAHKIREILPVERNDAHRLIEECMLAANVCAAKALTVHELPVLYRIHRGPKEEKMENLRAFLGPLGFVLPTRRAIRPEDLQAILEQIQDRPDRHLIQTVMLRSMGQAVYSPENIGHFGLNYEEYAHFTSPIRRYPDLLVHRSIRFLIRSKIESEHVSRVKAVKVLKKKEWLPYTDKQLVELGESCSFRERRADEATREVAAALKCDYMTHHIGEEFEGVISGVTAFGFFVELQGIYIDGLVHVATLNNDYYHFDAVGHRLVGEATRTVFALGQKVRVLVAKVNVDEKKIDFQLVHAYPIPKPVATAKPAATKEAKEKRVIKNRPVSSLAPAVPAKKEKATKEKKGGQVEKKIAKVEAKAGKIAGKGKAPTKAKAVTTAKAAASTKPAVGTKAVTSTKSAANASSRAKKPAPAAPSKPKKTPR